ncbi:DUF2325 domain-containing protein [Tissierella sp. Yu-01]|uniref:DUF2325 domain-containing protein n=1 Tax=Tissierella sp. Yu-01 TaxID=3035694 RepID=UPI00240DFF82|nr:DUF2325 domain-containing protein [Tissierella sp. Yu-01]WFA09311.1 DUF2325 domain-containing protein [Tissierella sp. Yu-01]
MSIVIIGGHDRMVSQYNNICRSYKCKLKLFTQISSCFKKQIGCPDLMILFTNTVSHKMVVTAVQQAEKNGVTIARSHSSSGSALKEILETYCY